MTTRATTALVVGLTALCLAALSFLLATAEVATWLQIALILGGLVLAFVIPPWPLLVLTIVLLPFEQAFNLLPWDLPINAFPADISLAAFAVSAAVRKLSRRSIERPGRTSPLIMIAGILALLLLAVGVISAANAGLSMAALRKLGRLAVLIAAVWAARGTVSSRDIPRAAGLFLAVAVVAACYGLLQGVLTMLGVNTGVWQFVGPLPRISGTFQDANFFAYFLSLATPIALSRVLAERRARLRTIGALAVLVAATIGTFSRGGLIATGAGVLVVVALPLFRHGGAPVSSFVRTVSVLAGLVAILGIIAYSAPATWGVVEQRFSGIVAYNEDPTGILRLRIMDNALELLSTSPVLGVGPGNFLEEISAATDTAAYAHNSFLEMTVETGIVGGMVLSLAVILLLIATFNSVRSETRADSAAPEAHWQLGVAGSITAAVAGSFFLSNVLFFPSTATILILLSAVWTTRPQTHRMQRP